VRQFLWLALLSTSTPTRYGKPSLWRTFAMADPNRVTL